MKALVLTLMLLSGPALAEIQTVTVCVPGKACEIVIVAS